MIIPIWSDTSYTAETQDDYVVYSITDSTYAVLFTGKAYKKPGSSSVSISIGKIAENYISSSLPDNWASAATGEHQVTLNDSIGTFYLNIGGTYVTSYTFSNDWSYSYDYTTTGGTLTTPISDRQIIGMKWLTSTLQSDSTVVSIINVSAGTSPTTDCWAIYYLQRNGGWASYALGNNVTITDKYTRWNTDQAFDNRTIQFERNIYHSEIETTYVFHTEWLSDHQADNLAFNLLSSSKAYLHNLYTGEIRPVIITNESGPYKTYKNQGYKLVQYQIEISDSQTKHLKA